MTTPVRVALIGMGRMGRALDALASAHECEVVSRFGRPTREGSINRESLNGAEVALEFSTPTTTFDNAMACLRAKCPVVVGTTGWNDSAAEFERAVHANQCAALVAPNFALGVQLFLGIAHDAARRLRNVPAFAPHLLETHHSAKLDAPSGTALAVQETVARELVHNVPITSVRVGSVPGTHELIFDAPFEQIRLVHVARDRRVFADGALVAARWLVGRRAAAVYSLRDVLQGSVA